MFPEIGSFLQLVAFPELIFEKKVHTGALNYSFAFWFLGNWGFCQLMKQRGNDTWTAKSPLEK